MNRPRVAIVMPAYNAEKTLEAVLRTIPAGAADDVILVDDASRDGTAALSRKLGLHTIVHPENRGYGGNQKTCYREALARGAGIAVMVHPDHQYDPAMVPALVDPLVRGECDAVFGSRMLGGRYFDGGMPRWKFLGNVFLTAAINMTTLHYLTECHSGFRAYSRKFLEAVDLGANSDDFVFDIEIILQGIARGMRFREVPISTRYFPEASSIGFARSCRYGLMTLAALAKFRLWRAGIGGARQFGRRAGASGPEVQSPGSEVQSR